MIRPFGFSTHLERWHPNAAHVNAHPPEQQSDLEAEKAGDTVSTRGATPLSSAALRARAQRRRCHRLRLLPSQLRRAWGAEWARSSQKRRLMFARSTDPHEAGSRGPLIFLAWQAFPSRNSQEPTLRGTRVSDCYGCHPSGQPDGPVLRKSWATAEPSSVGAGRRSSEWGSQELGMLQIRGGILRGRTDWNSKRWASQWSLEGEVLVFFSNTLCGHF